MKKYILPFLLAALSMGACRSLKVRDFHAKETIPNRLPQLGLLVHERSFLEAFDCAFNREYIETSIVRGPYDPTPWIAYDVTDQALQDVFHVLGNDLDENLTVGSNAAYGHARFKLMFYKRRNSGWGWTAASLSTMFLPNVLGMPVLTQRVELELQMEVVDAQGKVLTRYNAPGTGKATVAAYYGYDSATATRKANLVALKDAMSNIKQKLGADAPALASQLEAAGTLHKQDGK